MAPERGKKSPSTVAAECGADEILVVSIKFLINLYKIFIMYYYTCF